jgi:hypothetical protein
MRFAAYVKPALPSPPATVTYGAKVPSWPMYLNDQYGDCTCAAAGHMIQNWTANAAAEVTVPDASVLSFYEHFVGTPPPPDQGCNMLSVLRYWRKAGVDAHKVLAFTSIDLKNQPAGPERLLAIREHLHRGGAARLRHPGRHAHRPLGGAARRPGRQRRAEPQQRPLHPGGVL